MNQILRQALEMKEELVGWRRHIHQYPEVGLEQPKTAAYVTEALKAMGYEPQAVGGGVVAIADGGLPGKTFLIRGDMDALPMQEESGLPFASKVAGASHTCGHDTHTAMLLGAAQLLMKNKAQIKGRVKLMFQPAEEVGTGARQMVDAGVLEGPKVDGAMGLHSQVATEIPTGKLGCYEGPALASADIFTIEVIGKGCHGSRPEAGIDPINILCHIHTLLQTIGTREKPQTEAVSLTIGQIAAGNAPNVLPNSGSMSGTIRTFNQEVREFVKKRLVEIVEGTAKTLGGEGKVTFESGLLPTLCDPEVSAQMIGFFKELVGEDNVVILPPRMASEDFSEVTTRVPGTFVRLSFGSKEEGYVYDAHHPKNILNEEALPVGAAAYTYGAIRWLEENPI